MNTEETNEKGDETKSGCFGFGGGRMFEMMTACCADQGGLSGCSTMMKDMMETMRSQPCCVSRTKDAGPEEGKR